jgi:hypothetical protein
MSTFEARVALFKKEVADKIDLPSDAMDVLVAALKVAKFDVIETVTTTVTAPATTVPVVASGKTLNPYNIFMKAKMGELKDLSAVGAAWKALSETDKAEYKAKSVAHNATVVSGGKSTVKRALSGWQFYMKTEMKVVKDLKIIGANWKALPKDQQLEWTAKAKAAFA